MITLLEIYYEIYYEIYIIPKLKFNQELNDYGCDQEWEILTSKSYFRKNVAYYYTDLKIIRLGHIRHLNFTDHNNLLLSVQVNNNGISTNYSLANLKKIHIGYSHEYFFEYIEANFNFSFDLNINTRINIKVLDREFSTKNSIELIIKKYNENDNVKKHLMLCGKLGHSNDHIKYFDFWLKMMKISDYDKIILFNHTFNSDFNELILKYQGFIQIYQYNCLPNFLIYNNESFINFNNSLNKLMPFTAFFQSISLNECYLIYKDKYKFIAMFDFDELILPRVAYKNEIDESFYIHFDQYPDKIDPISKKSSKLIPYIDSLQSLSKLDNKVNIRFEMSNYLKHETMDTLFLELKNMIKLNLTKYTINQNKIFPSVQTKKSSSFIYIETEQDYKYAIHLYKMHKKYVEPFLEKYKNKINQSIPEMFNRFYCFTGFREGDKPLHKTIHYTNQTNVVKIHDPLYIKEEESIILSTKYGLLSHFREFYKRDFTNSSIQEIFFDFNYFHNYFKQFL
jgi:hypothetical protein